jgi:hypothetical protein
MVLSTYWKFALGERETVLLVWWFTVLIYTGIVVLFCTYWTG